MGLALALGFLLALGFTEGLAFGLGLTLALGLGLGLIREEEELSSSSPAPQAHKARASNAAIKSKYSFFMVPIPFRAGGRYRKEGPLPAYLLIYPKTAPATR